MAITLRKGIDSNQTDCLLIIEAKEAILGENWYSLKIRNVSHPLIELQKLKKVLNDSWSFSCSACI